MAINNISTHQVFTQTLNDVNSVSSRLTEQQGQLSSGNKSRDFAGLGPQLQQYLALEKSIEQSEQYLNDNQLVLSRLETTSTVLKQVIDAATQLNSLIAQRRTGVQVTGAFQLQVQEKWQAIAGQLNINTGDRYLFSGSKLDTKAIDTDNFPTLTVEGVPDTGYYTGSNQDVTLRASDNISITYNVRADHSAFQKIFAGLATANIANQEGSDTKFQAAFGFVQEGLQELVAVKATVDANTVSLENINRNHDNFRLYWQGLKEAIGNTDIVAVSTEVAVNQGILQAAFQAFAKINSLRLSDFLR